jgi:hypothetical protein
VNRYRAYWPLDDAPLRDGDSGFVGVDERLDPELLGPGMVASATNCRFRNGLAEPRKGITILPWMKADGRTPFLTSNSMAVWKVSPPGTLGGWVGIYNNFTSTTANDRLIGIRFGEIQTVTSIEVRENGDSNSAWKTTDDSVSYPVGVLHNGVRWNTAYTLDLALTTQELVIATSLEVATIPCYVEVRVTLSTGSLLTQTLTYAT